MLPEPLQPSRPEIVQARNGMTAALEPWVMASYLITVGADAQDRSAAEKAAAANWRSLTFFMVTTPSVEPGGRVATARKENERSLLLGDSLRVVRGSIEESFD